MSWGCLSWLLDLLLVLACSTRASLWNVKHILDCANTHCVIVLALVCLIFSGNEDCYSIMLPENLCFCSFHCYVCACQVRHLFYFTWLASTPRFIWFWSVVQQSTSWSFLLDLKVMNYFADTIFLVAFWHSLLYQDRENIERLEISGVGDPSGRGLGFSYVRVASKPPLSNALVKKKPAVPRGTTVTGTDADLRRLSMEAAREVCRLSEPFTLFSIYTI